MVPKYPSGRFLHLMIGWLIRRGVVRVVSRTALREGIVRLRPSDVVLARAEDLNAYYVAHELDAFVARFALWIREHAWDLERAFIRLGWMVVGEGDYYANARWRFLA